MQTANLKWALLIVLAVIWGSSFILIQLGLKNLNPFQLGSLRIVSAGLFLIAIGFRELPRIPKQQWKYIAVTSLFGTFLPAFLFAIAQTRISSVVSSILNSLTPLSTLILGVAAFGLAARRSQAIGVVTGFIGSALLILSGFGSDSSSDIWYVGLLVIASSCYAVNVNLIKKYLADVSPLAISVGNFSVMLIPAFLILIFSGFFNVVHVEGVRESAAYVMVLGVLGTAVANIMFFRLIKISSPVFASSVTYLIPVVAFFWGAQNGEMLTPMQFLGAVIVFIGVYLSGRK